MLKYTNYDVVFIEVPDETTLAINISGCPCHCPGCHSSYLAENIGIDLTIEELNCLIIKNKGITCLSFMGGDGDPNEINRLASHIRLTYPDLKISWYSGRQELNKDIQLENFDYIKLGPYVRELGGLDSPSTNQILYRVDGSNLIDITYKMRKD